MAWRLPGPATSERGVFLRLYFREPLEHHLEQLARLWLSVHAGRLLQVLVQCVWVHRGLELLACLVELARVRRVFLEVEALGYGVLGIRWLACWLLLELCRRARHSELLSVGSPGLFQRAAEAGNRDLDRRFFARRAVDVDVEVVRGPCEFFVRRSADRDLLFDAVGDVVYVELRVEQWQASFVSAVTLSRRRLVRAR